MTGYEQGYQSGLNTGGEPIPDALNARLEEIYPTKVKDLVDWSNIIPMLEATRTITPEIVPSSMTGYEQGYQSGLNTGGEPIPDALNAQLAEVFPPKVEKTVDIPCLEKTLVPVIKTEEPNTIAEESKTIAEEPNTFAEEPKEVPVPVKFPIIKESVAKTDKQTEEPVSDNSPLDVKPRTTDSEEITEEDRILERLLGRPLTLADREEYYWEEEYDNVSGTLKQTRKRVTPPYPTISDSFPKRNSGKPQEHRIKNSISAKSRNGNNNGQKEETTGGSNSLTSMIRYPIELIGHSVLVTGRTLKRVVVRPSSRTNPHKDEEMNKPIRKRKSGAFSDLLISIITGTLIAFFIVFPSLRFVSKEVYNIILKSTVRKIGEKVPITRNQDSSVLMPFITEQILYPKYQTSEMQQETGSEGNNTNTNTSQSTTNSN